MRESVNYLSVRCNFYHTYRFRRKRKAAVQFGSEKDAHPSSKKTRTGDFARAVLVLGNSSETTEFSGDFDGDGRVAPLTDGLLAIRYMFGFDGPALTAGALGEGATREDPDLVFAYAEKNRDQLDLDLDGSVI